MVDDIIELQRAAECQATQGSGCGPEEGHPRCERNLLQIANRRKCTGVLDHMTKGLAYLLYHARGGCSQLGECCTQNKGVLCYIHGRYYTQASLLLPPLPLETLLLLPPSFHSSLPTAPPSNAIINVHTCASNFK